MSKYFVRNYYTLGEVFEDFDLATIQTLVTANCASAETLEDAFEDVLNILYDEYQDWYIGFIDEDINWGYEVEEPTAAEILALQVKFLRKLMFNYRFSKDRYIYLLNLYEDQEENLMAQLGTTVSVTAEHRVNDTPQNGGSWDDDEHTSVYEENTSTTTTNADPTTVMARIDEIQNHYMNVLKNWCKEFDQLFIAPKGEFEDDDSEE